MKRLLRWIGIGLGSIATLIIIAYAVIYLRSEQMLKRIYGAPATAVALPTDPASIAEGERLVTIHGCKSCHGKQLQGGVLFDDPKIATIIAPNLTAVIRNYDDAHLGVAIRHGLRPDGRSMIVMPAEAFSLLTDEDLGRIVAFLRSLPEAPGPTASVSVGPIGRIGLVLSKYKTSAQLEADAAPPPEATTDQAVAGRYLARTICAQCHGADLRGGSTPDFIAPDLQVVTAYPPEAFMQLMRTGLAIGDRKLGVMSAWSRELLSHLTDEEIAALYSYLHALPEPTTSH